jgi:hypothetical protein
VSVGSGAPAFSCLGRNRLPFQSLGPTLLGTPERECGLRHHRRQKATAADTLEIEVSGYARRMVAASLSGRCAQIFAGRIELTSARPKPITCSAVIARLLMSTVRPEPANC